jgi:hypothetical protein
MASLSSSCVTRRRPPPTPGPDSAAKVPTAAASSRVGRSCGKQARKRGRLLDPERRFVGAVGLLRVSRPGGEQLTRANGLRPEISPEKAFGRIVEITAVVSAPILQDDERRAVEIGLDIAA